MFLDKNGTVRRPVAYLAGFEMFYPDGDKQGLKNKILCAKYGIDGVYPPDIAPKDEYEEYQAKDTSLHEFEKKAFVHDTNHLRRADMIIANLNDFRRGQEPDSGTCFECGVAYALGLRLYCFMDDTNPMIQRFTGEKHLSESGEWVDQNGCTIENFDAPLNLMFSVPFTVVQGGMEQALQRARADFDQELIAAGYPPLKIEE